MHKTLTSAGALVAAATWLLVVQATPAVAHVDRSGYTVSSQTPAGPSPHFPAFDPATGHALVSNVAAGTVTEAGIGAGPVRSFATGAAPHTVVVDDATRRAFVTNKGSATVSVLDLDTGAVTGFPVGPNPHGLAIDQRHGRLYVTSIDGDRLEVYDLATFSPVTTVPVGDGPWGVSVGPGLVAVTDTAADTVHLLDRDTLAVVDVVPVGAGPWNSAFLGGTLYVTLEGAGELVAVRGGDVAWRVRVGASPHGIVADRQRGVVLAAVTGADAVAVVDARRGTLLQELPVAAGPAGMAITSDGRVLVGNQRAGVVSELTRPG